MMGRLLAATATLVLLAACSGSSTTGPPGTSTEGCSGGGPIPAFSLASPAPGSTGVADSTPAMLFTGQTLTQDGPPAITLTASNGKSYTLTTFNATATGYSVPLPALTAGTTYTVNYTIQVLPAGTQTACPQSLTSDLGSFTTQ